MSDTKYTPTPWKSDGDNICQNNNGHFHVIARVKTFSDYDQIDIRNKQRSDKRHQFLVELWCPVEGDEEANAEFICRAVNCHDDLVEHVRLFVRSLEYEIKKSEIDGDTEGANLKSLTLSKVRTALAKAAA